MNFKHKYGPVEMAMEDGECLGIFARYTGAVRQGTFGPELDNKPDTPLIPEDPDTWLEVYQRFENSSGFAIWKRLRDRQVMFTVNDVEALGFHGYGSGITIADVSPELQVNPGALEAAYMLMMDEYVAFQEADRAMGDPYP